MNNASLGAKINLEYGKGLTERDRKKGKIPVYGSNGIVGWHSEAFVKGPGIIVGRKGTIGAVAWSEQDFWPIDTTYYVELKEEDVDLKWLYYKLSTLKLDKLNMATGTPGLNREIVYKIKTYFPDIKEQRAAAKAFSTIDSAIEKVNMIIEKTQKIKQGIINSYFHNNKKLKYVPLIKIFEVKGGTTPSTKNKKFWKNGTTNWITPADLGKLDGNINIFESERKISKEALDGANLYLMPEDSIIMSTRAPVGYVALLKDESTFNQGCRGLLPRDKEKVNTLYYCYYLAAKRYLLGNKAGQSTFKELSKNLLEKFNVPIVDIDEQNHIANSIATVDKKILLEKKRRQKLGRIKQALMNDLLTGKKRIKVD